eukprot:4437335-Prymnesium_polylepis.1
MSRCPPRRRPCPTIARQLAFATCGTDISRHMAQHLYVFGEALHAHDGIKINKEATGMSPWPPCCHPTGPIRRAY